MTEVSINHQIQKHLQSLLSQTPSDNASEQAQLNNALRLMSKWRSVLIQNTLLKQQGTVVMQGPLAGMDFLPQSAEGCHIAKLLGCYEQPLQPFIEEAIASAYPTILNIGCAEGYYAVGMARRMPNTQVLAFDLNPKAQEVCTTLAQKNGVSDRFKETHHITLVNDNGQRQLENSPPWFNNLAHLDQLLATWEWRSGATPWLVMKAR
jgi:2-polyprenyl-3-methyl-5-hydroxy-6-metoxy-1,4-benzoquinol methylase